MKAFNRDLINRAAWTFVQTFTFSFLVIIPAAIDAVNANSVSAAKAILISGLGSAGAAAFSAVKTLVVKQLEDGE